MWDHSEIFQKLIFFIHKSISKVMDFVWLAYGSWFVMLPNSKTTEFKTPSLLSWLILTFMKAAVSRVATSNTNRRNQHPRGALTV